MPARLFYSVLVTEHSGLRHRMAQEEEFVDDIFLVLLEVQSCL